MRYLMSLFACRRSSKPIGLDNKKLPTTEKSPPDLYNLPLAKGLSSLEKLSDIQKTFLLLYLKNKDRTQNYEAYTTCNHWDRNLKLLSKDLQSELEKKRNTRWTTHWWPKSFLKFNPDVLNNNLEFHSLDFATKMLNACYSVLSFLEVYVSAPLTRQVKLQQLYNNKNSVDDLLDAMSKNFTYEFNKTNDSDLLAFYILFSMRFHNHLPSAFGLDKQNQEKLNEQILFHKNTSPNKDTWFHLSCSVNIFTSSLIDYRLTSKTPLTISKV